MTTTETDPRVVPIVIVGARGRMGRALVSEVLASDDLTLAGAVDHADAPGLGDDIGLIHNLPKADVPLVPVVRPPRGSVVVDFSLPKATPAVVAACVEYRVPLVLGTTGLDDVALEAIERASEIVPIVHAANFSVGVTLLLELAKIATRALGPGWDAEIVELHHRHKRDAPSGTALRLGKAVADARNMSLRETIRASRDGEVGPRTDTEIGIVAVRGGDSIGEHTLMLLGPAERLELVHKASDRSIFAKGALRAARWICTHEHGLFDMSDVLGLAPPSP